MAQDAPTTAPVLTGFTADGHETGTSCTSPQDFTVRAKVWVMHHTVIPVILVPGVMGTNLTDKSRKIKVWRPPNGMGPSIALAGTALVQGPEDREKLWDPDNTVVDPTGTVVPNSVTATLITGEAKKLEERTKERGWGQVHWDSYGGLLNLMEEQLAIMFHEYVPKKQDTTEFDMSKDDTPTPTDYWKQILAVDKPEIWGAQKGFKQLTKEELIYASRAAYPVHAVGYNWLCSNRESGELLKKEIERIKQIYIDMCKTCDKVILISHSMGGLVSRSCSELSGGRNHILGILHGVQPAIGAPAAYKRIRSGFESAESVVLGRNAMECTAVLCNSPAGLELLPTAEYKVPIGKSGKQGWLSATTAQNEHSKAVNTTVIDTSNPYESIYADNNPDHWWHLVTPDLLDPAKLAPSDSPEKMNGSPAWFKYIKLLANAEKFHSQLAGKYHPLTYAYYAADHDHKTWSYVNWSCTNVAQRTPLEAKTELDYFNGKVELQANGGHMVYVIDDKNTPGDGTVPEFSAASQTPYSTQIFRHGGKPAKHDSYVHQMSYTSDMVQKLTLYSIIKMVVASQIIKEK